MTRQAYIKPESRALMIQQSGFVCDSLTEVNCEVFNYGGPGGDVNPQARRNFNLWDEEEDD